MALEAQARLAEAQRMQMLMLMSRQLPLLDNRNSLLETNARLAAAQGMQMPPFLTGSLATSLLAGQLGLGQFTNPAPVEDQSGNSDNFPPHENDQGRRGST